MPVDAFGQLQPLRIPTGWLVAYNDFREVDPPTTADAWSRLGDAFHEDLLQLEHTRFDVIVDVGWYPDGRSDGNYRAVVVHRVAGQDAQAEAWHDPIAEFSTRARETVVAQLEVWLSQDWSQFNHSGAQPEP